MAIWWLIVVLGWVWTTPVRAVEVTCAARVNPGSMTADTEYDPVEVTVTNTGNNFIYWVKIDPPTGVYWDPSYYGPPGSFAEMDYTNFSEYVTEENEFFPGTDVVFRSWVNDSHPEVAENQWVVEAAFGANGEDKVPCVVGEVLPTPTVTPVPPTSTVAPTTTVAPGQPTSTPAPTSTPGPTPTPITITVNGQTVIITPTPQPTPTPTPIPDTMPPVLTWLVKEASASAAPPEMQVQAKDSDRVQKMDYSIDGGLSWLPVLNITGKNTPTARGIFTPELVVDDTYYVLARAIDRAGNVGESGPMKIVIDTQPPQFYPGFVAEAGKLVAPNNLGELDLLQGVRYRIVVGTTGGATKVWGKMNNELIDFERTGTRGVWRVDWTPQTSGEYRLQLAAKDGADNDGAWNYPVWRAMERVEVNGLSEGVEMEGLALYQYQPAMFDFRPLPNGANAWVRAGEYYFELNLGKRVVRSPIYTQTTSGYVTGTLTIKAKETGWLSWLGPNRLEFESKNMVQRVSESNNNLGVEGEGVLLESDVGKVSLQSLAGSQSSLWFIAPWLPTFSDILETAQRTVSEGGQVKLVVVGLSKSEAKKLWQRGGFDLDYLVDEGGEATRQMGLGQLPARVEVGRGGEVTTRSYNFDFEN